jgi:hypothetical protein
VEQTQLDCKDVIMRIMTKEEAAVRLGIHRNTVGNYLTRCPQSAVKDRTISRALLVDLDVLADWMRCSMPEKYADLVIDERDIPLEQLSQMGQMPEPIVTNKPIPKPAEQPAISREPVSPALRPDDSGIQTQLNEMRAGLNALAKVERGELTRRAETAETNLEKTKKTFENDLIKVKKSRWGGYVLAATLAVAFGVLCVIGYGRIATETATAAERADQIGGLKQTTGKLRDMAGGLRGEIEDWKVKAGGLEVQVEGWKLTAGELGEEKGVLAAQLQKVQVVAGIAEGRAELLEREIERLAEIKIKDIPAEAQRREEKKKNKLETRADDSTIGGVD